MEDSPLMTPAEVVAFFQGRLGRNAVYEAIHRGEIPATRIGDRLFISRRKLVALFEEYSDGAGSQKVG